MAEYPIAALWDEAAIIRRRVNDSLASEMSLLHKAVGAVLSEKAGKSFFKDLKALTE